MRTTIASAAAVRHACMNFHYAKSVPAVVVGFNIYNENDEWCGVIAYGNGATPHIASPYDKWQGQVIELVRVALNGKQGHGRTSQALGMTMRMIPKYLPAVDLIVSYADIDQRHTGILYQATNWIYTGIRNQNERGAFIIHGKKTHPKTCHSRGWKQSLLWLRENVDKGAEEFITNGKHKYIYSVDKQTRRRIQILSVPYPKGVSDDGQNREAAD